MERQKSELIYDSAQVKDVKISCSLGQCPLDVFCRFITENTGYGIIAQDDISGKTITANFHEESLNNVLKLIATSCGKKYQLVGNTIYLGDTTDLDMVLYLKRVDYYNQDVLQQMISQFSTQMGNAFISEDCLVVMRDSLERIRSVDSLLNMINSSPPGVWLIQFRLLQVSDEQTLDMHLQSDLAMTFKEVIAKAQSYNDWEILLKVSTQIENIYTKNLKCLDFAITATEGGKATYKHNQRYPLKMRTTHENGSISESGYEYIDAGFEYEVHPRQSGKDMCFVELHVRDSSFVRFVDGYPITNEKIFDFRARLSDKPVQVGHYRQVEQAKQTGLTGLSRVSNVSHTYIIACAYRI